MCKTKILKRNQLIILVISLMLITAGYLNFQGNQELQNYQNNVAELGDATLVSTLPIIEETNDVEQEKIIEETTQTIDVVSDIEEYFIKSKLERENMYSQLLATYQEIYNNTNATVEQKENAMQEIAKINKTKNAIMISENLIIAKGFENVIIFVNEESVSVIVDKEELLEEDIAQIQNIITREINVEVNQIHISTKWCEKYL